METGGAHDAVGHNDNCQKQILTKPPASPATTTLATQARASLDQGQERISAAAAAAAAAAVAGETASGSAPLDAPRPAGDAGANPASGGGGGNAARAAGPSSGFGESDSEQGSEVPSTFRA